MTDIYGSQDDVLLHNGLADADDPEDFQIKLARLETVWESLVPGFHRWFTKHRSEQFKTWLVLSARQNLGITGRFYTNGLELKHRLQKKRQCHINAGEVDNGMLPGVRKGCSWFGKV